MREVVKVASKVHSAGYYTQWRDAMKPGEVEFNPALPSKPVTAGKTKKFKKVKNERT